MKRRIRVSKQDKTKNLQDLRRKLLDEMIQGLERIRVGEPRPDRPVYVREGDHFSVLVPGSAGRVVEK